MTMKRWYIDRWGRISPENEEAGWNRRFYARSIFVAAIPTTMLIALVGLIWLKG
jgi:hypothetical protein